MSDRPRHVAAWIVVPVEEVQLPTANSWLFPEAQHNITLTLWEDGQVTGDISGIKIGGME